MKSLRWFAGIILGLLAIWISGFLNQFLPAPERARLAIENVFRPHSPPSEEHFRFVLTWLANDDSGDYTSAVKRTLNDVPGIETFRSARIVKESGATLTARERNRRKDARKILKNWNADLAIVGSANELKDQMSLNLWLMSSVDYGKFAIPKTKTLYVPENGMLPEELRVQLISWVLSAAASASDTEAKGQILTDALRSVGTKIEKLIEKDRITEPERHADLSAARGIALLTVGQQEGHAEPLKEAVDSLNKALEVYTPESVPLVWAATQNNLGAAFQILGEQERDSSGLEDAVEAFKAALQVYTYEGAPLEWATTQSNLGATLGSLGEREFGIAYLEDAEDALNSALRVLTFSDNPTEMGQCAG